MSVGLTPVNVAQVMKSTAEYKQSHYIQRGCVTLSLSQELAMFKTFHRGSASSTVTDHVRV